MKGRMRLDAWFVALVMISGAGTATADPKAEAKEHMARAAEARTVLGIAN